MKKILVAAVLGLTTLAGAQDAAQPAQQPAAGQSQGPVIKDPAEYNAYVAAYQQKDPAAQISGLEAFLTQYPNSVMKSQALDILMQDYQKTNNVKKTMETGQKLVALDPCNVRALTLLAYFDRMLAQQGDPNATQLMADGQKYADQGLGCLPKVTDPETLKLKPQMEGIFHGTKGIAELTAKDYANAQKDLKAAVDASPQEFGLVYPLALSFWPDPKVPGTPENSRSAIWYAARASVVAPTQAQPQIEKYARSLYRRFHGADDGWDAFLAQAKAGPNMPDLNAAITPAPTPADQAHAMAAKDPKEMDFATWEFILQNGSQDDRDKVWNAIKGQPVQLNGTVFKATAEEFDIAASLDDIEAKKADITLTFEAPIPKLRIPKEGASLDFQGEPASYTPDPFMMKMEKGKLAAPAKPTPAHHAAPKKPAASR